MLTRDALQFTGQQPDQLNALYHISAVTSLCKH